MKITNVRACQPMTPESPNDWRTSLGQILIAVDTDAGLTGYGVGGGGFAGIHVARTVLRDCLIGQDPDDISRLWRIQYDATLAFGQKGLVLMAISGVDLALWDLKGRAQGVPVHELLGGARTRRMPTYVTVWDNDALAKVSDDGHHGFKLHMEELAEHDGDADRFADRMADHVREARSIIGPDRELMADAWMRWDLPTTKAVIDRIAEFRISWLEEPIPLDDVAGYAELVRESPIPIAGGEHEYTAAAFEDLIANRLHSVLQPDVCWCGGLSELIRIYEMASDNPVRVCPHRGSELWSLPVLAALDPDPLAESGRRWMTWVEGQPPIVDGWIEVSDSPGLGLEIDETSLETYPTPSYDAWRH